MTNADRILRLDRQQGGPDGVKCPVNPDHGRMGVHISGDMLMCTAIIARQPSLRMCQGHVSVGAGE